MARQKRDKHIATEHMAGSVPSSCCATHRVESDTGCWYIRCDIRMPSISHTCHRSRLPASPPDPLDALFDLIQSQLRQWCWFLLWCWAPWAAWHGRHGSRLQKAHDARDHRVRRPPATGVTFGGICWSVSGIGAAEISVAGPPSLLSVFHHLGLKMQSSLRLLGGHSRA
jgi:hypothetical protein